MKSRGLLIITGLVGLFLLCSGGAQATSVFFSDDYANWPGYPVSPPYTVNPNDQIGVFPTVTGATITYDANNFLQSIDVGLTNPRGTETLFINAMWDPSQPYDQWDYVAQGSLYSVSPAFTPADYTLVTCPPGVPNCGWRVGHPYQIQGADLTPIAGLTSQDYVPGGVNTTDLVYTFAPNQIQLFDANTRYVIGVSEDCGNDVFLALSPVPEPLTLLLLGAGLLGLAGVRRNFKK